MSYRDLDAYQLAFELAVRIARVSKRLPKHEMYEVGSQLRRAAKSIPANIAEGYGRRRYKQDYIWFVTIALASCDETRVHLDMLQQTSSLDSETHGQLSEQYDVLGRKLTRFLQGIIEHHGEPYC